MKTPPTSNKSPAKAARADSQPTPAVGAMPSCADSTKASKNLKSIPYLELPTPNIASQAATNLLGNGFLRRGQTGMFIGSTGIGKSVVMAQAGLSWAVGRSFFGIKPQLPLKVLIVQSENDDEDMGEMRDGIMAEMNFTPAEMELARSNIRILRSHATGAEFLLDITPDVIATKPDLLLVDPLFAYAGVDIAKDQPGLSKFLRGMILPFSITHNLGVVFAHHTNKPPAVASKSAYAAGDFAYSGSGHNELANFARFVAVIRSIGSLSVYEFRIGKRGKRAGLVDENGKAVHHFLIKHSAAGIGWQSASEADLAAGLDRPSSVTGRGAAMAKSRADRFAEAFFAVQKGNTASLESVAKRFGTSEKTIRRLFGKAKILVVGDNRFCLDDSVVALLSEVEVEPTTEEAA